jgi:hypothetical protein
MYVLSFFIDRTIWKGGDSTAADSLLAFQKESRRQGALLVGG